jgi:hypothetical protein
MSLVEFLEVIRDLNIYLVHAPKNKPIRSFKLKRQL